MCDSGQDAAMTNFYLDFNIEKGVTAAAMMGENSV